MTVRGRRTWLLALGVGLLALAGWLTWRHATAFDMRATLARLAAQQGTWDNPWDLQPQKIADLRHQLATESAPIPRLILTRAIAQEYVNGGTAESAIDLLERTIPQYEHLLGPADMATLKADLAFAYFRLGEQQNCAGVPGGDYCIFPLQESSVHSKKRGAEEAAKRYLELLQDAGTGPRDALFDRWMLTLCIMQLGRSPSDAERKWTIPASAFASEDDVGRFAEVAAARGVVEFGRAGGTILEDFDNNGHLDLMFSHMGMSEPLAYFRNQGDGTFRRATAEAGLAGLLGGLNMVQADYDNDGCIDVFIPRGAWYHDKGRLPASLLHNNCDGTFTDVTERAGLANGYPSQAAVWADFNNDGLLDLFVGNEIVRDKVNWPSDAKSFRLYINQGNGTFVDVGEQSGIHVDGMIKGVAAADFANDGRVGLYVTTMGQGNHLFRNVGQDGKIPHFVDVTEAAGVGGPAMSFTTWFFDYDNDGWLDLFVSGYSATMPDIVREMLGDHTVAPEARARLYRNRGDGTFVNVAPQVGLDRLLLTMGANFGDLDNDGWLDIYLGTGAAPLQNIVPNRMFRNQQGKAFADVTTSGGFGHLQKGHGVAFGDIDNNGQQDVVANIGGAMSGDKGSPVIFKNPGHPGRWLTLHFVGRQANRFAIGARVEVVARQQDGSTLHVHRMVGSGGSFGASSLRLHVGLGAATAVESIIVRWPGSGTVQQLAGPKVLDAAYEIREGDPEIAPFRPARDTAAAMSR